MERQELINELNLCVSYCDACYDGCSQEQDRHMLERCMMLDKECREICRLTASLLEAGSENADKFVKLCADICKLCAEECHKHAHDHCQECAAQCDKCYEMCVAYFDQMLAL